MSYTYSFADNAEYGADDLNALVRSLVTSGVEDKFADGAAYNASVINGIIQTVYSEGVVPESVNTLKVSKVSDGTIAIAPGLAFFADGSTIRITAAHELSYTPGVKNYVYLKQDLTEQNRNYPVCSTDEPTGDVDVVLLAEITSGGSIEDKRTYARGRVPGYQSNANCSMVINAAYTINTQTQGTTGTKSSVYDMGANNYSRVIVIPYGNSIGTDSGYIGIYSFLDNSYLSLHSVVNKGNGMNTDKIVIAGYSHAGSECALAYLTFSVNAKKLTVTYEWSVSSSQKGATYPFTMILC